MSDEHARNERNIALTRAMYDATGSGNWEAAADMLTADFEAREADCLPYGGTYRGRNALKELYTKVMGMLPVKDLDIHAITAGENRVMVLLSLVLESGEAIPLVETMRFREDGKCCEIVPYYFNPEQVQRAVAQRAA